MSKRTARQLLSEIETGSQRLYDLNFVHRCWIAEYVALVDEMAERFEELVVLYGDPYAQTPIGVINA